MEVPEESFHWSSWDSRTCYPQRAFIQGLTDDFPIFKGGKEKGPRMKVRAKGSEGMNEGIIGEGTREGASFKGNGEKRGEGMSMRER